MNHIDLSHTIEHGMVTQRRASLTGIPRERGGALGGRRAACAAEIPTEYAT
jgi:hypothetical protein